MTTDQTTEGTIQYRTITWRDGSLTAHFVSIDGGDLWLETDRRPDADDRDSIAGLIAGDGQIGRRTFPMMVAARYFSQGGDVWDASEIETINA